MKYAKQLLCKSHRKNNTYDNYNKMTTITKLKQARKQCNIMLQDMAYLLDMDISNLSKYERGIKKPTLTMEIAYYVLTKAPLQFVFKNKIEEMIKTLSLKVTNLIAFLEDEIQTDKISKRITALNSLLDNISCVKEVSEKDYE